MVLTTDCADFTDALETKDDVEHMRSCAILHPCHPRNPWSFRHDRSGAQSKSKALLNVCRRKHPAGSLRELSRSARLRLFAANLLWLRLRCAESLRFKFLSSRLSRAAPRRFVLDASNEWTARHLV